jgi:hypothetical protein
MTQSNPLFAAVNDECSFEEYECGTRVIAFDTEEDATRWVSQQEDFADWIIVPLEHSRHTAGGCALGAEGNSVKYLRFLLVIHLGSVLMGAVFFLLFGMGLPYIVGSILMAVFGGHRTPGPPLRLFDFLFPLITGAVLGALVALIGDLILLVNAVVRKRPGQMAC